MENYNINYRNVCFRIDSGYLWGSGLSEEKLQAFQEEITSLFIKNDWEIKQPKFSYSCPYAIKGKNKLYLHPMEVSGVVQEDLIHSIEDLFKNATTFTHYRTDIYKLLMDMSDKDYQAYLETQKDAIIKDLLDGFETKRKNLFITMPYAIIERVKEKYRIERVTDYLCRSSNDIEWVFVQNIFDELVSKNRFDTAKTKSGVGYRTKIA